MTKQDFWFEDITILLDKDHLNDFIPLVDMNDHEKLNAMVRFCIYLSVLLILFTNNVNYIFIIIGGLILTYAIYTLNNKQVVDMKSDIKTELLAEIDGKYRKYVDAPEKDDAIPPKDECIPARRDNIFANVDMNKSKLDDCKDDVKTGMLIEQDRFVESNDNIFEDKMSLRQFYKVPNANDADSRKKFMEWCYKSP
jgi:hypothetical protein